MARRKLSGSYCTDIMITELLGSQTEGREVAVSPSTPSTAMSFGAGAKSAPSGRAYPGRRHDERDSRDSPSTDPSDQDRGPSRSETPGSDRIHGLR